MTDQEKCILIAEAMGRKLKEETREVFQLGRTPNHYEVVTTLSRPFNPLEDNADAFVVLAHFGGRWKIVTEVYPDGEAWVCICKLSNPFWEPIIPASSIGVDIYPDPQARLRRAIVDAVAAALVAEKEEA